MYLALWIQQQSTWFPFMFDKSKHQGQRLCAWMCTAGRVYVHIYSLYLGQTCLLLSTQFIVSSMNISKHWKKTHNLSYFFSKLKALHLQTWLSSHLFISMESLTNKSELCATEQCHITEFMQSSVDEMIY